MKINSKVCGVVWNIETNKKLNKADIDFIETFNPIIHHNVLQNLFDGTEKATLFLGK